jgi:large subunit ribosomal protein L35
MPKIKTHRGAHKRVKVTGTGKIMRRRAFRNHFLSKKRASRRRLYGKSQDFDQSDTQNVKRMTGI